MGKVASLGQNALRGWVAADVSTVLASWTTTARPADHDIRSGLRLLRARSREAAQNNDHARQFLSLVKANVIGRQGIRLQAKVRQRNGRLNQRVNDAIEAAWYEWLKRGACEITGRLSGLELQRLLIETVARDGECLFRVLDGWETAGGFVVEVIDPEALDVELNSDLPNGNTIRMGVELDGFRRPVAYHLHREPGPNRPSYQMGDRVRVPAAQIMHLYLREWVWQTRGVPWMATALHRMKMLEGFEDAAVTAARAGASKMGFYKPDAETATPYATGTRDVKDDLVQEMDAGTMEVLPPGYEFQGWDPAYPNTDYADFVKALLRSISAGLGVSYNALASDLEGVNYSSLRTGALQERDLWMMLQDWWIDACMQPLFERWLRWSLDQDLIKLPSGLPLQESQLGSGPIVSWQARRWPWVDPLKDMQANREAVDLRTISISAIIREQGRDPEEVWAELSDDLASLSELGLAVAKPSPPPPRPASQTEED